MNSSAPVLLGGGWRQISADMPNPDLSGPCGILTDGSGGHPAS